MYYTSNLLTTGPDHALIMYVLVVRTSCNDCHWIFDCLRHQVEQNRERSNKATTYGKRRNTRQDRVAATSVRCLSASFTSLAGHCCSHSVQQHLKIIVTFCTSRAVLHYVFLGTIEKQSCVVLVQAYRAVFNDGDKSMSSIPMPEL
jgi:hypothetical protein